MHLRAVKGIIQDKKGRILLLQRIPKFEDDADCWDFPGGIVEEGEDEKKALVREVFEETGISVKVLKYKGDWKFNRAGDGKEVKVKNFLCIMMKEKKVCLSNEHKDFKWIEIQDIQNYAVKDISFYKALKSKI